MQLSKHLFLSDVIKSNTAKRLGISNNPTKNHLNNLRLLGEKIFDPIVNHFGKPINISSGYRSKELNSATPGASSKSQHSTGEAIDLDQDNMNTGVTNKMVFDYIKDNLLFDQLILEYPDKFGNPSWVHVSYKSVGNQRKQILIATRENGRPKYTPFTLVNYKKLCPKLKF